MSASLFPFAPQQWFGDTLPNAGGKLWVYQRGTSTPATGSIWWNIEGTTPGTNPVVLDAAGRPYPTGSAYLSQGSYTVVMLDQNDAQVCDPVDIQVGSTQWGGNETINEGIAVVVKTYADVRGLIGAWDVVYVCGRAAEGDGGQGWFQFVPGETGVDDDGICLVANTRHYVRVYDAEIDPLWYGLVYSASIDQTPNVLKVLTASDRWNRPVALSGSVYVIQNITVSNGQSVRANVGGRFYSSDDNPVTMTFQTGSHVECAGETFGVGVSPKFQEDVVQAVRASWMGGLDDAIVAKLVGCAASGVTQIIAVLDQQLNVGLDITFPSTVVLDVEGGAFHVTAPLSVNIPKLAYAGYAPWLTYGDLSYVGNISFGGRPCFLEWFGAVADGTADDSIPWKAGVNHGNIQLLGKYKTTAALTVTGELALNGDLASAPGFVVTSVAGMPSPTVIFSGASTRLTLSASTVFAASNIGLAFDNATGKIDGNITSAILLFDNCVVYSAATTAVLTASRMSASSCSLTSKALIGPSGSNLFYSNCTFGVGAVGYNTHVRVETNAALDYLVPPSSGPNPPLVCRPSDKSIQLQNSVDATLLQALSLGTGQGWAGAYLAINPTDAAVTYITASTDVAIDLPTASDMSAYPAATRVRVIVLCRTGVGSDNTVYISNASQSCWWGQATSDPDTARSIRIPAPTTYRMGSVFYFVNGRWAQLG